MENYLLNYIKGFPFLDIVSPATLGRGIFEIDLKGQNELIELYEQYKGTILKFVPASGAASRMFKDLYEAQIDLDNNKEISTSSPASIFFHNIKKFPFYLSEKIDNLSKKEILEYVLGEKGLNYGSLPKGQILFHKYNGAHFLPGGETRTAFEEHLVEGALYAKESSGEVNIHFTVSPEHLNGFKNILSKVVCRYEARFDCKYNIFFSIQEPSTDIIAVNEDNTPFIKQDGTPLYRPGGHGALLNNLNKIDADIIFLKNIDNIIREELIGTTLRWKMILAGKLLEIRHKIFNYLVLLDTSPTEELITEIIQFLDSELCVKIPKIDRAIIIPYLHDKLNRPIRVCGMVKNEGEPGGGPFIVYDNDMSTSLQILEGAQIDKSNPISKGAFDLSTHFNPVDIVCSIFDYKGKKFDLSKFVDPQTGLISSKSYEGKKLKAQELPGLWNGSMSNWNTLFVETPIITFNPVKTVNDLLRREHLGDYQPSI